LNAKDLLMLGTYSDLSSFSDAALHLPLKYDGSVWVLSNRARLIERIDGWLHPGDANEGFRGEDNSAPDGVIEGIRSPYAPDRSLVLVLAKDDAALAPMTAGLLAELPQDDIRENVSVWQSGAFTSYWLSAPTYSLGDASWIEAMRLLLPLHPALVAVGFLMLCMIFSIWLKSWIQQRIRERLSFPGQEQLLLNDGSGAGVP